MAAFRRSDKAVKAALFHPEDAAAGKETAPGTMGGHIRKAIPVGVGCAAARTTRSKRPRREPPLI